MCRSWPCDPAQIRARGRTPPQHIWFNTDFQYILRSISGILRYCFSNNISSAISTHVPACGTYELEKQIVHGTKIKTSSTAAVGTLRMIIIKFNNYSNLSNTVNSDYNYFIPGRLILPVPAVQACVRATRESALECPCNGHSSSCRRRHARAIEEARLSLFLGVTW